MAQHMCKLEWTVIPLSSHTDIRWLVGPLSLSTVPRPVQCGLYDWHWRLIAITYYNIDPLWSLTDTNGSRIESKWTCASVWSSFTDHASGIEFLPYVRLIDFADCFGKLNVSTPPHIVKACMGTLIILQFCCHLSPTIIIQIQAITKILNL